jgi:hypothetical protein
MPLHGEAGLSGTLIRHLFAVKDSFDIKNISVREFVQQARLWLSFAASTLKVFA